MGEFVRLGWNRDDLTLERDFFGNVRLLTTTGRGFVAASDSLLVLAALRRALNDSVNPHEEVLTARAAPSQIAGQQLSPDTIIEEVRFVLPGTNIRIDIRQLAVTEVGTTAAELLRSDAFVPGEVRDAAISMTRTISALSCQNGWSSVLHLSGGLDSRAVYAAAVAAGKQQDLRFISRLRSGDVTARDNVVANRLATTWGTARSSVDDVAEWRESRPEDGLRLWASGLAGVYDGLGPLGPRRRRRAEFELFGLGAGAHKGAWGWTDLNSLAARAAKPGAVRDALSAQMAIAARALGVDPEDEGASEVYYFGFRNGLHSAAEHIGLHLTGVSPLQNVGFARRGHARTREGAFGGQGDDILALTALLSPEAAVFEYDEPRHAWTLDDARDRQRDLGGPLRSAEIAPYTTYGSPDDIPQGPSRLSLTIAERAGYPDSANPTAAFEYAEANLDLLDGAVRETYREVLANARWRLAKADGDIFGAELPLSRLLMLGVFRPAG
ncbi:hypothetical protein [Microbacterium sp. NPDC077184]|uniref:hypothetical protein n=1 Tax=Microbacterium sp. NPDC077184 TaxID=3154764 RepID=UPI0034475EB7